MIKDKNSFIKGVMTGMQLGNPERRGDRYSRGFRAKGSASSGTIFNGGLAYLVQADEWKAKDLLIECGLQKKILVTVVEDHGGMCGGIFFDKTGVLTCCSFKGPYPWRDDRNYGMYNYDDVTILKTSIPRNYVHNAIFSDHYRLFYSIECAEKVGWSVAGNYDRHALVPAYDLTWKVEGKEFTSMTHDALYYKDWGGRGAWDISDGEAHSTSDESISNDWAGLFGSRGGLVDPKNITFY